MSLRPSLLPLALLVLAGCGGSGDTTSTGGTLTRAEVERVFERSLAASATIRAEAGERDARAARSRAEAPVFDADLQVWKRPFSATNPQTTGFDFFLDEAATLPAGSERDVISSLSNPFRSERTLSVTAGPRSGLLSATSLVVNADGTGRAVGSETNPGVGRSDYTGDFGLTGDEIQRWSQNAAFADGSTETHALVVRANGDAAQTSNLSSGVAYTLTVLGGQAGGSGRITGPSASLPADVAWGEDGRGTITFADGSTEAFDFRDL